MATEFKLLFEGEPDLDVSKFQQSLPSDFKVEKRNDGIYITVKSKMPEDKQCQYHVDRELDRHFFLTYVKMRAEMVRRSVFVDFKERYSIHGSLADDIKPQNWTYDLAIQLRLWGIAAYTYDVQTKLLLLFQIIELTHPLNSSDYPVYNDLSIAPCPLTECKLIRHLVAHAGEASGRELKLYCEYLGLPSLMLDITDPYYNNIIASKVELMEREAKKVIENAL